MTKVAYPLGLLVCLFIYVAYIKWHWASATQAFLSITETASGAQRGQQAHSPQGMAARGHEVFYGIMFDAGSTGTRVHIFQFSQQPGGAAPGRFSLLSVGPWGCVLDPLPCAGLDLGACQRCSFPGGPDCPHWHQHLVTT